jgi:putative sigma-54 modulation protein
MIKHIDIKGFHTEVHDRLKKYIIKRIGRLDRYIPRQYRADVRAEVIVRESKSQSDKKYTAEVILHLPEHRIEAKEATLNMFAAIDIVEAKLKNQLKRYKDTHTDPHFYRKLIRKFRRSVPA